MGQSRLKFVHSGGALVRSLAGLSSLLQRTRALAKSRCRFQAWRAYLSAKIDEALAARLTNRTAAAVPSAVLANFISNQLFAQLQWWLDHGMPYSPERMDEIFHGLVNPTVQSQLSQRATNNHAR